VARRLGQQIDVVEQLAPGVDWSFAQPEVVAAKANNTVDPSTDPTASTSASITSTVAEGSQTIGDIEEHLTDQVELVAVMSEIADVSKEALKAPAASSSASSCRSPSSSPVGLRSSWPRTGRNAGGSSA
jgi:hypothetical protein